ncbi:conserved hypothetical protein [Theileria equi strain WA]|uniref:Casein kinase substrate phosphoprotein PP28 domain-containing protein n=1 Tax=Theileria equi strain WA TaxID=1537102 RepID=L1LEF6_THEEQ|nr:conserved hypothetical protein [Theileria equi strain WA]EKX73726.1 conserved hypothetical protein [Theileria equi strain WA]|eukprot:XP_004833178.1 conserved hypothetical protein [Theileria equi strain WA]
MVNKTRGSHKKFSARRRSRYLATEEEIIERNKGIDKNDSDEENSDEEAESSSDPSEEESSEEASSESSADNTHPYLIEVCNPNKNRKSIEKTGIVELSRREREELKRQQFERQKMKLMAEGKLASAKADLERLAKIRKEREEAMARKMEKLKLKEQN